VQQTDLALRRVTRLCSGLDVDATLRDELRRAGFSKRNWARLVDAVRRGESGSLLPLLDAVEAAATAAGLDGVTVATRQYQPLPGNSPGVRTVSGWRCPHPRRCERVAAGADPGDPPRCALTNDPLAWVSVTST
jgi:hypothetical protein